MSGAVPPPAARLLGRSAGVPRPVCPGCGPCGRGDPAPVPQRAPLRAGIARCGGGGRASPGGLPFAVVRGVWGQALPLPQLPALWAGCRGPLPTCCGRGCGGVGAQHWPRRSRALWRAARHGDGGGRLGSEAGSDPLGHLGVTWGVYLCASKPPLADIILSHPPELTRCDSVIGLAIPAMSGHIQYRGTASGDLYIGISGISRVLLS